MRWSEREMYISIYRYIQAHDAFPKSNTDLEVRTIMLD